MKSAKALICLAFIALTAKSAITGQIDSQLREKMLIEHNRNRFYGVIAVMTEQADISELDSLLLIRKSTLPVRHNQVVSALQAMANHTQPPILSFIRNLESTGNVRGIHNYWITNMIAFEGKALAILAIATLPSIDKIYLDVPIGTIWPISESKPSPPGRLITGHESGLDRIHAPQAWALGYTGYGRVVANLDTGVDGDHPALHNRFRGDVNGDGNCNESWFDPYITHWTYPTDSGTHGTHTMGTICGRTDTGDTIGVAIDARWIAAACIDRGGGIQQTVSDALLAIQWIADPDGNPTTADNPDACGNSWGIPDDCGYTDCDQTFWIAIDNCEAAGTVMVFAAGNEGTAGLRSPSDRATTYHNCFSVGAVDGHDPDLEIAPFSARGPSECARGNLAIKPEVVAPGVDVRSSIRGGGYQVYSGTSMACPHVAGAVAIIRQANPNLDATTIKQILIQSATNLGQPGDDNTYGNGIINLYNAVMLATDFGGACGYAREASTGNPLAAKLNVVGAPIQVSANTAGYYYIGLKADTTYNIEASCYGYLSARSSAYIALNDTTRIDFDLIAAPTVTIQGTILSGTGQPISAAEVKILDTPLSHDTTDNLGFYQIMGVPSGASYFIEVEEDGFSIGFDSIYIQAGIVNNHDIEIWPIETFEQSDGNYTGINIWQWGIPTYGPDQCHSGTHCWGTILDGTYPDLSHDTLFSEDLYVKSPSARIQFYHWYQFEDYYDGGNVIASTDNGNTWQLLIPSGGYPENTIPGLDFQPGYTGISDGWESVTIDLADYYQNDIIIGWVFGSDASINKAGWYIDDVTFSGCIPPPAPELTFSPNAFNLLLEPGEIEMKKLYLNNSGVGPLIYRISASSLDLRPVHQNNVQQPIGHLILDSSKQGSDTAPYYPPVISGHGGPDTFGYLWKDSDEPQGPIYDWIDISSTGTSLTLGDDDYAGPIPLNFDFPYYGNIYSALYLNSNGIVSFEGGFAEIGNSILPNGLSPNNLIALWWDDLNPASGGNIVYYQDQENNRFIVSFIEVPNYSNYSGTGALSFQALLYPTGKIILQYQSMNPGIDPDSLHGATIGIENASGTDGLQIVYNANYIHNQMAIAITRGWLNTNKEYGIIRPGYSDTASVILDATYLGSGIYRGVINLQTNDINRSNFNISVNLIVGQDDNPVLDFNNEDLYDSLSADSVDTKYLTIFNRGEGFLLTELSTNDAWIQIENSSILVAPYDSLVLPIEINSLGLAPGVYQGVVGFSGNDPGRSEGFINIELLVFAPHIELIPLVLADTLEPHRQTGENLIVSNTGLGKLIYTMDFAENGSLPKPIIDNGQPIKSPETQTSPLKYHYKDPLISGSGRSDDFGYRWVDSHEPTGPIYSWQDISGYGNPLAVNYDNQNLGPIALGFAFPYYGISYDSIKFCTNGWLSFTSNAVEYNNISIPDENAPSNLLAIFWDDLIFNGNSRAYYYTNQQDSAIFTWENVYHTSSGGPYTFQVIILGGGRIVFQYQIIEPPDSLATIGIQNQDGSRGLLVSYDDRYASDSLAIEFWPGWVSVSSLCGEIPPLSQDTLQVEFNSRSLNIGTYSRILDIHSNDPAEPLLSLPVTLEIISGINTMIGLSDTVYWDTLATGEYSHNLLFINNFGYGLLNYFLYSGQDWLTANRWDGSLIPQDADTIIITIDAANLRPGEYLGGLTVLSNDPLHPQLEIAFRITVTGLACSYLSGDINGDSLLLGSDITFGVRYFKGFGNPPPDSCYDDSIGQWLYVSGDVNGNCEFRGSDITYLVAYFKSIIPSLLVCPRFSTRVSMPKNYFDKISKKMEPDKSKIPDCLDKKTQ